MYEAAHLAPTCGVVLAALLVAQRSNALDGSCWLHQRVSCFVRMVVLVFGALPASSTTVSFTTTVRTVSGSCVIVVTSTGAFPASV